MKTTRSAFSGFPRDRYTTLPETDDRLMATKITAIWRYGSPDLDPIRLSRRSAPRCSRSSPTTTAHPSRPRSGSWPGRSSSAMPRSRRSGWSCPTSITGWSTWRLRPGQRPRDLHADDRAARARSRRPSAAARTTMGHAARGRAPARPGPGVRPGPDRAGPRVRRRPPAPVRAGPARPARAAPGAPGRTRRRRAAGLPGRHAGRPRRPTGPSPRRRPTSTTGGSRSPGRPSRR